MTISLEIHENPAIKGSPLQAFLSGVTATFFGRGMIGVYNPLASRMLNLNPVLRGLLAASPVISTMLTQIPMAHFVSKNGGKKPVLIALSGAFAGMLAITGLSAATDITSIDQFNLNYVALLVSGILIGGGSGAFLLMITALNTVKDERHIAIVQSAYGSIADLSGAITPVVINLLSPYGFYVPFALYSSLLLAAIGVTAQWVVPTPYQQLRQKNYDEDTAKRLAMAAGQLEVMISEHHDGPWREVVMDQLKTMSDLRGIAANVAFFIWLGSLFTTETIFPTLLENGFGLSQEEATYAASIALTVAILARIPAGRLLYGWDHESGGVNVLLIGTAIAMIGVALLAFLNLSSAMLYASIGAMSVGCGFGIASTANLAIRMSSKQPNERYNALNVSTMLGQIGTFGTAGGLLLPVALGVMEDTQGQSGNKNYFAMLLAMMFLSTFLVYITSRAIKKTTEESLFGNPLNLFQRLRNMPCLHQYTFSDEAPRMAN